MLFIATANFPQNIPAPLMDRMEMVEFSGYTEREKVAIAKQYLVPKKLTETGLVERNVAAQRRSHRLGGARVHPRERRASAVS